MPTKPETPTRWARIADRAPLIISGISVAIAVISLAFSIEKDTTETFGAMKRDWQRGVIFSILLAPINLCLLMK